MYLKLVVDAVDHAVNSYCGDNFRGYIPRSRTTCKAPEFCILWVNSMCCLFVTLCFSSSKISTMILCINCQLLDFLFQLC